MQLWRCEPHAHAKTHHCHPYHCQSSQRACRRAQSCQVISYTYYTNCSVCATCPVAIANDTCANPALPVPSSESRFLFLIVLFQRHVHFL